MRNATAVLAIGAMYMLALTNANAAPMLSDPDVEVPIASRGNVFAGAPFNDSPGSSDRSEERRVGKECRSRWSPYH